MPRWYKEFVIIKYVKNSKITPEIIHFDIFLNLCIDILKMLIFHKMSEFLAYLFNE